ncbi:MAG: InlB B-repeat-containing protein [Candidatus Hydrogenedens sp.]
MSGCPSEVCKCGNNERTITTEVIPPGAGSISLEPEKESYTRGENVLVTFTPETNYKMYIWIDTSSLFHLCPSNTILMRVTDNIQLTALPWWTKRKVHVFWDTSLVDVEVPEDAVVQSPGSFEVEREVDSLATFSGQIKENLPPLPPGQVRKMLWDLVSIPTHVGQRWGETSCSIVVEGPSSPTAEPIYLYATAQAWDESSPVYSMNIFSASIVNGENFEGRLYCNGCGCEWCTCLSAFPYEWTNSGVCRKFMFSMRPSPYEAFVFWLGMQGYNLSQNAEYTFESPGGGSMNFYGLYAPRIHLSPSVEGQGVIHIESGGYTERWGYNPMPFCIGGECSGWVQEDISNCVNILGNKVVLKAEPCNTSWIFDHWEYLDAGEGEGNSGSWVEIPDVGDRLNTYMNWWGYLDETPGHLHVPWGETNFQVKAVFRRYGVFTVQPNDPQIWWPTIIYNFFEEKGYNSIMVFNFNNFFPISNFKASLHNLPKYDVFLYSGHHAGGCLGDVSWQDILINNHGHGYLLVYLLACNTANIIIYNGQEIDLGERWKGAFNASCFIGFEQILSELAAQSFDTMFYHFLRYYFPHSPRMAAELASWTTTVDVRILGDVYLPFCEG